MSHKSITITLIITPPGLQNAYCIRRNQNVMSRVCRDHPHCCSSAWICMCAHTRDVVIFEVSLKSVPGFWSYSASHRPTASHICACVCVCLDWKTHGSEYYECSRYKENPNIANESAHAQAREALKKYIFYFERVTSFSYSSSHCFLANVNSRSRSLCAIARPSVVCL